MWMEHSVQSGGIRYACQAYCLFWPLAYHISVYLELINILAHQLLQCITKQGRAVSFVGGSCVVVVAAGADPKGNISLWDTVSPRSESCIGYLSQHKHPVNCLQTLPGGWLLASADDKGALSVSDVRMIGSSSNKARTLWNVRASRGKICAIKTLPLDRIQMQPRKLALSAGHGTGTGLVTAGDDGIVRIWDASSGKLVQETDPVYEKTPRAHGLLHLRSGENKYSITDLSVCDEGIITCGTDGIVRLYPKLE
jgi:WD40 repeat protein